VKLDKKRFIPEDRGMIVTAFLVNFFKKYVEYDFTALLENQLDQISEGNMQWKKMLSSFWQDFIANIDEAGSRKNSEIIDSINESLEKHFFKADDQGQIDKTCPSCKRGKLSIKLGKYGAFFACSEYPECNYIKSIDSDKEATEGEVASSDHEDQIIGQDKSSGEDIILKKGPYGFYLQLGVGVIDKTDKKAKKTKPKRCSVPSFVDIATIDLKTASYLISMPIDLGLHPETQKPIKFSIGKFGPYLSYNEGFVSVPKNEKIFSLSLDDAILMIDNNKSKSGADKKTSVPLAIVGAHPKDNKEINIFKGRFGPYIKYDEMNISIPKKYDINEITMDIALELIEKHIAKKLT
jgi:DNA topoisomerase-1